MRRLLDTATPAGVLLCGLLVFSSSGCHLIFPYSAHEQEPEADFAIVANQDGEPPKPQVDLGITPDSTPVNTCTPGRLLRDDFESETYSKSQWSAEILSGDGALFITSQSDGGFKPVSIPDTDKYMYFAPADSCCSEGCNGANQLTLVSRPLEMRDCEGLKIELYFITGPMEVDQDELSVEYRIKDGNWRSAVSLFPEINRTPMVWMYWQVEISGIKSSQVQVRFRHTSQCSDDIAAIDRVEISRY
jgi:hypothetical protein